MAKKSCCTDLAASFECIVNAAVAHTWLVYIHPFIDGNGRVARLLMNLMLMRCWHPIAIITREDRLRYYDALETSQHSDLSPFLSLLSECVNESLEEYESAVREQREQEEWARSLVGKFAEPERVKASNEYEVWRSALDLLKNYIRQTSTVVDAQSPLIKFYFHDYGMLDFEKYLSLRSGESAKKTWFFRVDFVTGRRSARYLFFFGYSSPLLRDRCYVTLHVAREEPPGSYYYERLDQISASNVPALSELGYDAKSEKFIARYGRDDIQSGKIEVIGRRFFEQVVKLHFSS